MQQADGGFGFGGSTVHETCLSLLGLESAGEIPPSVFSAASTFLLGLQAADGSFSNDVFLTALALRVLNRSVGNLHLENAAVIANPENPIASDPVSVQVQVENKGLAAVGPFEVALYQGDPASGGSLLGTKTVAGLAPAQAIAVDFSWQAPSSPGQVDLFAVVDAGDQIAESDEQDNQAARSIFVLAARDLEILGLDFVPEKPAPGQEILARVQVGNSGGADLQGVTLRLFDGDPALGGTVLADALVGDLGSLETALLEVYLGVLAVPMPAKTQERPHKTGLMGSVESSRRSCRAWWD